MARFIVLTHPEKKKFDKLFLFFVVFALGLAIFTIVSYIWDGDKRYFGNIVIFGFLLWSSINRLRRRKREHFIDISEDNIEWLVSEESEKVKVGWKDIRWIKQEQDGTISLFQESSFSKNFSLKNFTVEDSKEIIQLLEKTSLVRNIRLINFSEPASAVA